MGLGETGLDGTGLGETGLDARIGRRWIRQIKRNGMDGDGMDVDDEFEFDLKYTYVSSIIVD